MGVILPLCVVLVLLSACYATKTFLPNTTSDVPKFEPSSKIRSNLAALNSTNSTKLVKCYTNEETLSVLREEWLQSSRVPAVEAYQTEIGNTRPITYAFETIMSFGPNTTYTLPHDKVPRLKFEPSPTVLETRTVFVTRSVLVAPSDDQWIGIDYPTFLPCEGMERTSITFKESGSPPTISKTSTKVSGLIRFETHASNDQKNIVLKLLSTTVPPSSVKFYYKHMISNS
jgi:hypothetical protein